MFSATVFRPLVYLALGLQLVARVLRLKQALAASDRFLLKLTNSRGTAGSGLPTILALALVGWAGLILGCIGEGVYHAYVAGELLTASLVFPNAIICGFCLAYTSVHKNETDRCKVEWYARASLVLSIAALSVTHPAATAAAFIGIPVTVTTTVAAWIWTAITWVVTGLVWCITALFASLLAGSIYALAGVAVVIVMGALGYVATRFIPLSAAPVAEPRVSKEAVASNFRTIVDYFDSHYSYRRSLIAKAVQDCPQAITLANSHPDITWDDIKAVEVQIATFIAELEQKERDRDAKRSALCKKWTETVATLFRPFTIVWKQVRIAGSYAKALLKARKEFACPFVRFHD